MPAQQSAQCRQYWAAEYKSEEIQIHHNPFNSDTKYITDASAGRPSVRRSSQSIKAEAQPKEQPIGSFKMQELRIKSFSYSYKIYVVLPKLEFQKLDK